MSDYPDHIEVGEPPFRRMLDRQPGQLLLEFNRDATEGDVDALVTNPAGAIQMAGLSQHQLLMLDPIAIGAMRDANMRWVECDRAASELETANLLRAAVPLLERVSPIYLPQGETELRACAPYADDIIVKLDVAGDPAAIAGIVGHGDLDHVPDPSGLADSYEHFRAGDGDPGVGLKRLAEVEDVAGVASAEFDWLAIFPLELAPNGVAYWNAQWNLTRINATAGWDIGPGKGDVTVAVIDNGFALDHPSLKPAFAPHGMHCDVEDWLAGVLPPYQATSRKSPHGTLVAGLLASSWDAGAVAGIAPGCAIVPVRVEKFTSRRIAAAIKWARLMGASVINMSFSHPIGQGEVIGAVAMAWNAGTVLCGAAGNAPVDDPSFKVADVAFPAALPQVIAVGASDQGDRRKTEGSLNGDPWRSRYGDGLDLVAPGMRVPSTDLTGDRGWNNAGPDRSWDPVKNGLNYVGAELGDEPGDYLLVFWGTSASVAHVSGAAALIRSAFPDLSNAAVRAVIESSCRKIGAVASGGPYAYGNAGMHPAGTWNPEVGHGLLDVGAALAAAQGPGVPTGKTRPIGSSSVVNPVPQGDLVPICGYLGRAAVEGRWRIYSSDLGSYLEIADDDLVSVEPIGGDLEGCRVWISSRGSAERIVLRGLGRA